MKSPHGLLHGAIVTLARGSLALSDTTGARADRAACVLADGVAATRNQCASVGERYLTLPVVVGGLIASPDSTFIRSLVTRTCHALSIIRLWLVRKLVSASRECDAVTVLGKGGVVYLETGVLDLVGFSRDQILRRFVDTDIGPGELPAIHVSSVSCACHLRARTDGDVHPMDEREVW